MAARGSAPTPGTTPLRPPVRARDPSYGPPGKPIRHGLRIADEEVRDARAVAPLLELELLRPLLRAPAPRVLALDPRLAAARRERQDVRHAFGLLGLPHLREPVGLAAREFQELPHLALQVALVAAVQRADSNGRGHGSPGTGDLHGCPGQRTAPIAHREL